MYTVCSYWLRGKIPQRKRQIIDLPQSFSIGSLLPECLLLRTRLVRALPENCRSTGKFDLQGCLCHKHQPCLELAPAFVLPYGLSPVPPARLVSPVDGCSSQIPFTKPCNVETIFRIVPPTTITRASISATWQSVSPRSSPVIGIFPGFLLI